MHNKVVCFIILLVVLTESDVTCAKDSNYNAWKDPTDDELFPIYECDERSRSWTKHCLIPLTNAQLSIDLCETGEKVDPAYVKRCARDLQILSQSCPQPGPVSALAKDMIVHSPPPPSQTQTQSFNMPRVPKAAKQQATGTRKKTRGDL